jgi:cell wall-associated NlpC family hydrolase
LPSSTPTAARAPQFEPVISWSARIYRVSRSGDRGPYAVRYAGVRPAAAGVRQAARQAVVRQRASIAAVRREVRRRQAERRAAERRAQARELAERAEKWVDSRAARLTERRAEARRTVREAASGTRSAVRRANVRKSAKRTRTRPAVGVPWQMAAVVIFARSQVGKRYAPGGDGPNSFDCSGFTKRAYAQIGLRLPHSSGAQAARARAVPRSAARPGDLVVGPGHVGVYMGRGMMIDAGNRRTGVVYRRLYAGLHIERF